jgi:KDO2-lipid IV(A) lauroyltransferase
VHAEAFVYHPTRAVLRTFALLPLPLAYSLAHGIARLAHGIDRKHRRIGLTNLHIAFPEQSAKWRAAVLKRSYVNWSDLLVEVSRFPRMTAASLGRRVSYSEGSLDRYRKAKDKQAGVLFFTAHIGAWELLPFAHGLFGYPLSFVVRPLNEPTLDRLLAWYRELSGNRVIPKKDALRELLRVLKNNGDVGILVDQSVVPSEGVFVPFFGKPACTTNGAAMIALRTGAALVPGFLLPAGERGRYLIHFGEEVEPSRDGTLEENIRLTTGKINQAVEEVIRRYPDQWFWVHQRWKQIPPGTAGVVYP